MADRVLAALDAERRERLQALGLEVLVLRTVATVPPGADIGGDERATIGAPRARLIVRHADARAATGTHAALMRAILAALGLRETDTTPHAVDELPTLAFGNDGAEASVVAPALEMLRDARAKRALWPALRSLRRRLAAESDA